MLDGRVKTLHPKVHGGILARRDLPAHAAALREHGIPTIDLVVVNLYPFRATVAKPGLHARGRDREHRHRRPVDGARAAKNWPHVGVVVDPADYAAMLAELAPTRGALCDATRFRADAQGVRAHGLLRRRDRQLADRARGRTARRMRFPDSFHFAGDKVQEMRYGENPHQTAAFYRDETPAPGTIATYRQLQGKELSYNNVADTDAAWECVKTFARAGVRDRQARESLRRGHRRDAARRVSRARSPPIPTSAFGGIIAFNRAGRCRRRSKRSSAQFLEVLIAPAYTDDALALIGKKVTCACSRCALPDGRRAATRST